MKAGLIPFLVAVAVQVLRPHVDTIFITGATSVAVGATTQLVANLRDIHGIAATGREVIWTTDRAEIAVVDPSGLVVGVAPGTTGINAYSEGKLARFSIAVTP